MKNNKLIIGIIVLILDVGGYFFFGNNTSEIEIVSTTKHGIWLWVSEKEYFLSYQDFPWFEEATIKQIYDVELLNKNHLHWPGLDVDLHLESLDAPHQYPLIYK